MSKLLKLIREQRALLSAPGTSFYISDHPMTDAEFRKAVAAAGPGVHFFMRDRPMTEAEWERERCGG